MAVEIDFPSAALTPAMSIENALKEVTVVYLAWSDFLYKGNNLFIDAAAASGSL